MSISEHEDASNAEASRSAALTREARIFADVGALFARGLIAEVEAGRGGPVWRETGDDRAVTLVATDATLHALGIEPASGPTAAPTAAPAPAESLGPRRSPAAASESASAAAAKTREGDEARKQAQLIG